MTKFDIGEEAILDFDGLGKKDCRVKITAIFDNNVYKYKYLYVHPSLRLEDYGLSMDKTFSTNAQWLKKIEPTPAQVQEDADINLDIVIRALMFTALYSPDDDEAEIFLSYARELLND